MTASETTGSGLQLDNDLWRFSLAVYRQAGVSEEMIAVQDRWGADVNFLLFAAWAGAVGRHMLSRDEIESAWAVVASWCDEVVAPLRSVRRFLRPYDAVWKDNGGAGELRPAIKRSELLAEQIEQALLHAWWQNTRRIAGNDADPVDVTKHNLDEAMRLWQDKAVAEAPDMILPATLDAAKRAAGP